MLEHLTLAAAGDASTVMWMWGGLGVAALILVFFLLLFAASRYKRCPSNRVLVVFGRVGAERASKCIHGGGVLVWPLIQDYAYLSLDPIAIEIPLQGALSQNNIRVNVPSTFTCLLYTSDAADE